MEYWDVQQRNVFFIGYHKYLKGHVMLVKHPEGGIIEIEFIDIDFL